MRVTSSRHTLDWMTSFNMETGIYVPSCLCVNFTRLAECLLLGTISDIVDSDSDAEEKFAGSRKRRKGKRVRPPRPAKRMKLEPSGTGGNVDDCAVPIIHHTFEIDFAAIEENQAHVSSDARLSILRDFRCALNSKCDEQQHGQGQVVFDLGTIYPHAYQWQVHACKDDPFGSKRVNPLPRSSLLVLPALLDNIEDSEHDFNFPELKNILISAFKLQQNKRARVTGTLNVIVPEPTLLRKESRALPAKLRVEVTVSLLETTIFDPLSTLRKRDCEMEEAQRRVLIYAFGPVPVPYGHTGNTDMSFFLSALRPAPLPLSLEADDASQPVELLPKLLPFQRRTVNWLLSRERKRISTQGRIEEMDGSSSQLPLFWEKVSPTDGKIWYLNRVTGRVLNEEPPDDEFLGGILAEEPGLGKTLESIALVLLNPSPKRNPSISRWDPVGVINVKEVKTTLIVTPASLAQQWIDELKLHAPSLKVFVYEGWTKVPVPITAKEAQDKVLRLMRTEREPRTIVKPDDDDFEDDDAIGDLELTAEEKKEVEEASKQMTWCDFVNQYDICIATYNNLQQDLGVARAPLQRPRREVAKYVEIYRDRSPLVMVEWNRVIMDEVQMVGGGKTEEMVSLIPRLSSFAVSGTPARSTVNDLIHVIRFLRINAVTDFPKAWMRLQKPAFAGYFEDLFRRVAVRTMKAKVQDELTIPEQKRFLVPIDLGKVEKHVYDEGFKQALDELGLDSRGVTASSGWQIDVGLLRTWMRRLRGICTHPQVGKLSKQNERLAKAGTMLKSIGEVLEEMKEQNWRKLMDERKSKIQILVRRAQLTQQNVDSRRYKVALEILLLAQNEMDAICTEITSAITEHDSKGELLRQEAALKSGKEGGLGQESSEKNGEGQREGSEAPSEESLEDDFSKTSAAIEYRHKKNALQLRLREAHIVLHQIHFRLGDVYHSLGDSNAKEDKAYGAAEELRKRLLKTSEQAANRSILQLRTISEKATMAKNDMEIQHCGEGGEMSEGFLREADGIIDILNVQTELLFEWRARIIKLLTESLSSSNDKDADGEEYARTLETQGEAETFLQAYAALLADRREMLVAERTALAAHDVRERKIRHTVAAQRAQRAAENYAVDGVLELDEMQPEHEVLQSELSDKRKAIRKDHNGRAIKSVLVDLQGVAGGFTSEREPERITARKWITNLKSLIKEQTTLHEKLEADMVPFRKAFNDRVQYFRQLQEVSDTVRDVEWEGTVADALARTHVEEEVIEKDVTKLQARRRYLKNLADNKDEDEDDGFCVLCRCDFVRGFMTPCAHVYCEGCLKAWFARKEGKACPVCRVIIDPEQLQRISLKESKNDSSAESLSQRKRYTYDGAESAPRSRRVIEYNTIDPMVLDELKKIDCLGSYGSKIETLVRHLLYLEDVDPGCKSIVFSAWADSLYILERAMKENGIMCLRIDQKKGKENAAKLFKTDHRIRVLLLHGERENAGLNVTCASRVFLTESVVQHSFELQAIARIDRLGQTRPTEVYCYYAENTVERNILDLAARRGLSLYTKDQAVGTVKVTSFEMDNNRQIDSPMKTNKKQKGQKGDFIYKTDDMLAILFPHLFEEMEYLLPDDLDADMLNGDFEDGNYGEGAMNGHPIAGPSRLAQNEESL